MSTILDSPAVEIGTRILFQFEFVEVVAMDYLGVKLENGWSAEGRVEFAIVETPERLAIAHEFATMARHYHDRASLAAICKRACKENRMDLAVKTKEALAEFLKASREFASTLTALAENYSDL